MTDAVEPKPERDLTPTIAFAVPAVLLPLAFVVGTVMNLSLPEPKGNILPKTVEEIPEAAPVKRMYLPVIQPLEMTLPDVNKALGINIAVAVPANADPDIRAIFMENPEGVLAPLSGIVLDLWSSMGPDRDIAEFRKAIPPLLAHEMNRQLRAQGISDKDPILEVLIMKFSMAH